MAPNKPCCIDLFQGDDVSDDPTPLAGFDLVAAAGIPFLIHKASEGLTEVDSRYAPRRAKWMAGAPVTLTDVDGASITVPRKFGAYHFFHGADEKSAVAEAKHFLAAAALTSADEGFLDWETVGKSYEPSAVIADAFCKTVEDALGRPCWVYGGNVPREQLATAPDALLEAFAARPGWFCQYGAYQPALLPKPWQATGPVLWQDDGDNYGPGPHRIPGITTLCDNSTVVGNMTVAKLAAAWGAYPTVAPVGAAPPPQASLAPRQSIWQALLAKV
jgi:hypothetical protein